MKHARDTEGNQSYLTNDHPYIIHVVKQVQAVTFFFLSCEVEDTPTFKNLTATFSMPKFLSGFVAKSLKAPRSINVKMFHTNTSIMQEEYMSVEPVLMPVTSDINVLSQPFGVSSALNIHCDGLHKSLCKLLC